MKRFIDWVIVLFVVVIVTGSFFVGRSGYDAYQKNRNLEQEIAKLQEKEEKLSFENEALEKKMQYFRTGDFTEREAKEKLNLKHPAEEVVVVKEWSFEEKKEEEVSGENILIEKEAFPLYKKWWNIFFSPLKK
jgi:cell division protein FtsB